MNKKIVGTLIAMFFICTIFNIGLNAEFIANVVSDFESGLDGWTCNNDGTASWESSGGNPGGFFKIDESVESKELIKSANDFQKALEDGIKYAKRLEELKSKENIKDFISEVMNNKNENFLETINALDNGFRSKNMNFEAIAKNYFIAAKYADNNETKTKINEIVEVIRRIEKEVRSC